MQSRSTDEVPSSAAPEVKNENFLMDIFLDVPEDQVAYTNTAILEGVLTKYCQIFQCLFQELPDHLEQCGCNVEMEIGLVRTDPPYNVRRELGRQKSDYDLFT